MMQGIRRWRNIPGMRTLFILLALSPNLVAQGLSAADVAEIRSAIDEEGKSVNQRGSGEVWSERGPGGYGIRSMELVLPGVAIASAVWMRPGAFPQAQPYSFILTKGDNRQWKIVRKLAICPGGQRFPGLQPICALRVCWFEMAAQDLARSNPVC